MGLINFGRIGTSIKQSIEERKRKAENEKAERWEVEQARKKALHEERLRQAPIFAREQVKRERKELLKSGGGSGWRDTAANIGAGMNQSFENDLNFLTGGGGGLDFGFGAAPKKRHKKRKK